MAQASSNAGTAVIPQSPTELKAFTIPQLTFISTAPFNGKLLGDTDESILFIESDNCRETFYGFKQGTFPRFAAPTRFTQNTHVPCQTSRIDEDALAKDFKIDFEVSSDNQNHESVLCLYRQAGKVVFAAKREFFLPENVPNAHKDECKYLLNVLLYQAQPLPIAVPIPDGKADNGAPVNPSAPLADGVPNAKANPPKTVFSFNGDTLVAGTDSGKHCEDRFSGFNEMVFPDEAGVAKVVKKLGLKRCHFEIVDDDKFDITGKYRLTKANFMNSNEDGVSLECNFKELRPHNPKEAMNIKLVRMSPKITNGPVIDEPTRKFINRAKYLSNKEKQRRECIFMLDSFVKTQNAFFKNELKGKELTQVLLPSVEAGDGKEADAPTKSNDSGLGFGTIMLIVAIVLVVALGGFVLLMHLRKKRLTAKNHGRQQTTRNV